VKTICGLVCLLERWGHREYAVRVRDTGQLVGLGRSKRAAWFDATNAVAAWRIR
jgi:hypothetical protein